MKFSKDFETSSNDRFESVSVQTMFELEETYKNLLDPEHSDELSDEEIRQKLLKEKTLFWQYCVILDKTERGYEITYTLKCPNCLEGKIIRISDRTPGFKDSFIIPCKKCGLTGGKRPN